MLSAANREEQIRSALNILQPDDANEDDQLGIERQIAHLETENRSFAQSIEDNNKQLRTLQETLQEIQSSQMKTAKQKITHKRMKLMKKLERLDNAEKELENGKMISDAVCSSSDEDEPQKLRDENPEKANTLELTSRQQTVE